jgi:hypothetical protein
VWIKICWEDIFCHLPKNQESGKDLRNFWDALINNSVSKVC